MSSLTLASLRIESEDDAVKYIEWLADRKRQYHFDDSPSDIIWGDSAQPGKEDLAQMVRLHEELWKVADPWELFDKNDALWRLYIEA
jgi:hypothetical protein